MCGVPNDGSLSLGCLSGVPNDGSLSLGCLSMREVPIGKALGENGFSLPSVQAKALRLLVLFVPGEAQPAQSFKDRPDAGLGVALHIGVVQPQHHGSLVVAGIEPIENKGAGAAHMQKTRGRRCETNARS